MIIDQGVVISLIVVLGINWMISGMVPEPVAWLFAFVLAHIWFLIFAPDGPQMLHLIYCVDLGQTWIPGCAQ